MKIDFDGLDRGQHKAVTSLSKNVLCLAGAGSGKTRVLTYRIYYLVHKLGIKPENILTITFTKNAAEEMRERLGKMNIDTHKMWCLTFHSAAYRILKFISDQEYTSNFKFFGNIVLDSEKIIICNKIFNVMCRNTESRSRIIIFLKKYNWNRKFLLEQLIKTISLVKNSHICIKTIKNLLDGKSELCLNYFIIFFNFYDLYRNYFKKKYLYDFADLLDECENILNLNKNARDLFSNKFRYILVDEFQDVNVVQVNFLKQLLINNSSLFAVGDDWQAIYGFRGGIVEYILKFSKYFGKTEKIVLPYNYRCDGNVVKAASKVIANNVVRCRKVIRFKKNKVNKINKVNCLSEKESVAFVCNEIRELQKLGVNHRDIMILGRYWRVLYPYINIFKNSKINIRTIHKAKGNESMVVFLVGLHMGRYGWPCIKNDDELSSIFNKRSNEDKLCEERRIFYVGITRAEDILYLVKDGERESIFMKEIPRRYSVRVKG